MAKRKRKKSNSFKRYLAIVTVAAGALYALAQHYYPEEVDEFRARIEWLVNPYYGMGANISSEIEDADLLPESEKRVQILKNTGYISGFSNAYSVPLWVGYVTSYPFK